MVTLADIARHANVSSGTVSRVLNNKTDYPVSPLTVERIRRAAQELGYLPNVMARALATGKAQAIGLCYHSITEPMFLRIFEAVEAKARERGYHLIVSSNPESFFAGSIVDGLVYVGGLTHPRVREFARHKPVVFVGPSDGRDATPGPNTVTWSEYDAAFLAVKHLAELGHRTVGALWGDDHPAVRLRVEGFRAAVAQFGLTGVEETGGPDSDPAGLGYAQMERLLARGGAGRPTAVFARNDYLALGAMKRLFEMRIAVPGEMSVIYYGSSILGKAAYVELSSVSHPNAEASVIALERLIAMIDDGVAEFPNTSLPITLREHDSCAPPAAASPSPPSSSP